MADNALLPAGWILTEEAHELTGYSIEYLRRLGRLGKVRAEKLGGALWAFDRASLEAWQVTAKPGPKPKQ